MDRPDQNFYLITFLLAIVCIVLLYHKQFTAAIYLIAVTVVYFLVGSNLNSAVRDASTHGNTVHGWYSKGNGWEQFQASMWFYFFPLAAIIIPLVLAVKFGKSGDKR